MDITPLISADAQVIQSYSPGMFRIAGRLYEGPVLVFPDHVEPWQAADFAPLITRAADLDVVLYGCGAKVECNVPALKVDLKARGLLVDIMDTGAACRTYNVLLSEGRRVAAALVPV